MRKLILLTAVLLFAACKDQAPEPPNVSGKWTGSSNNLAFTFFLTQTGGTVTGNGTLADGTNTHSLTVSGTYVPPSLSMNVAVEGFEDFNFTGQHANKTITGTMNGSGMTNRALTITKQQQ